MPGQIKGALFSALVMLVLAVPILGIQITTEGSSVRLVGELQYAFIAAGLVFVFKLLEHPLSKLLGMTHAVNLLPSADRMATYRPAILTVLIIFAFIWPFTASRGAVDVATLALIYVMLGLGLNIVVGFAGLLDLGYVAFYAVGAYSYALLTEYFGLSFWVSLPIGAGLAALFGFVLGFPVLRLRGDYLAIVTLGFGEIVRILLNNWMELTNGPNGLLGIKPPSILIPSFEGGLSFEMFYLKKLHFLYYIALALAIVTVIAVRHLNYSRIGRAWESIREDETAAELMGVNTFKLKLLAYAMGALFAGLAGSFFCARMRFVSPESFTFLESAMVLSMVVLGGMGSIPGIILGAAALIVLPEVFREFETYRMLVFGMSMVVMMLFRPAGLIPAKRMGKRGEG